MSGVGAVELGGNARDCGRGLAYKGWLTGVLGSVLSFLSDPSLEGGVVVLDFLFAGERICNRMGLFVPAEEREELEIVNEHNIIFNNRLGEESEIDE